MTGKQLYEEYQKLPEDEKMKFDIVSLKSRQKRVEEIELKRKEILNNLSNIKNESGELYFNKEYLEKVIIKGEKG